MSLQPERRPSRSSAAPRLSRWGVSHQAAPNNSAGSKPPGRLPRPDDCGRYAPRPRNSCVPHADHSKRRGRAVASGLSSDSVRHEGGLAGDRLHTSSIRCKRRRRAGGHSKRRGRELGHSRMIRDPQGLTISPANVFVPGCLSSDFQLPGAFGFLMASLSSYYCLFYPH